MKFVSPKIDYAFKKIFGSQQSQDILISFLNAIIYGGEKIIQSLTIVNPFNPGQLLSLKDTYLDVKAVLVDGSIVVIEMQVARMAGFNKRVAYNLAKAYANQLETGEDYLLLNPAIAVTITDFILFPNTEDVINQFVFQEKTKKFECLADQLQLIFVELPKFQKALSELNSLSDKWIYFLKEATHLDSIPENLGEVSEIGKALNIANKINMTAEELDIVERRGIAMQDERGRITYAEQQGRLQLIMRQLKKRFGEIPEAIISQIEDLSVENLDDLGEDFLDFNSLEDLLNWLQDRS
ncbi:MULTISPECIES: Rpn family recombination-promoting nuclease/putative transposase [Okeania]|uniref:Rpn family recombination-promoting nuclease/putative transposase n=1 Tax=Okeania hirsuta TaxID=1458930 RepID=A0A3N6NI49_9CYAN|nr:MULTISPECIES: Rpn family recombination-promoting nuclease/putative transposase [Okeania]NES75009.1 Rpn family recombination-promoting nuclease/putative transposase [Okeania sp. SIO1H4]NES90574.1 Rpn family recombination-promoting nuclease/putative transposase [Okeania sp. SIO2B9]NET20131.1 Rpn family recombination-promoting nuclease/putative transposase [Okeania sp. SIO1H5]NET76785.1 Rpn family recombination-promoting nuclease/putative transposase [Okeania sp. SIO1F9]NET92140.1 Rpn family r